jgi:two-component system C4-dicarboxylate transport response regulator DctD
MGGDKLTVAIVDDELEVRNAARQTLDLAGYEILDFAGAEAALADMAADRPGVIVTDVRMPGMDGFELLRRCQERDSDLPVIMVTGHGDISMAVRAMREGAYDFIEKPFRSDLLTDVVRRAAEKRALVLENRGLRSKLASRSGPEATIIGRSSAIREVHNTIANIAGTDVDVLINGETGSGKELVARCLHDLSNRSAQTFVAINCGAVPESVFESELFGHEAGAFTGASSRRIGKIEYADRGTLFLDEIESMPLTLQVKVLRVLQERVLERLGSNKSRPVDIRVVAATKEDLKAAVNRGDFRADLYYRLDVVRIDLPPLRDRVEDITMLFEHFVLLASQRYDREPPPITPSLIEELSTQRWPGNVRELQNAAHRFVLSANTLSEGNRNAETPHGSAAPLPQLVDRYERSLIVQALRDHSGNLKNTYTALGLPRKTLYEKMRRYGLDRKDYIEGG